MVGINHEDYTYRYTNTEKAHWRNPRYRPEPWYYRRRNAEKLVKKLGFDKVSEEKEA